MSLPNSPRLRWLPVATVAAAALAAALWLTVHPAIAALATPPGRAAGEAAAPSPVGTRPDATPDPQAEFNRVVERMAYTRATQRFLALRSQGSTTPELVALARQLDEGLPQRVARQELGPDEARALQAALRDVLGAGATLP